MIFNLTEWRRVLLAGAAMAALSGCGGGGGGGGIAFVSEPRPEPGPLAPARPATDFETPEFFGNYGLDMIGAQFA